MYKPIGWDQVARSSSRRMVGEAGAGRGGSVQDGARDAVVGGSKDGPRESIKTSSKPNAKKAKAPSLSAVKHLSDMLSDPTNRSCAECRTHLADTSQIYASFNIGINNISANEEEENGNGHHDDQTHHRTDSGRARDMSLAFKGNHKLFAPPKHKSAVGFAHNARQSQPPPHGIFICQDCSLAHIKVLDQSKCVIKPIQSGTTWIKEEIDTMLGNGGNSYNRSVYEAYVPPSWEVQRPKKSSNIEQRESWVLAKYGALGFVLPNGPLGDANSKFGDICTTVGSGGLSASTHSNAGTVLPNRLVDYFCVVGSSGRLDLAGGGKGPSSNLSNSTKPSELRFEPVILDQYPKRGTHADLPEVPVHLPRFVFPEGLRPRPKHLEPKIFAFVLTGENGTRLYGTALHVYDKSLGIDALTELVRKSLGKGEELPTWLRAGGKRQDDEDESVDEDSESGAVTGPASALPTPDIIYFPKCLVLISHHPFHDIFRTVLKQIYKISLVESPLPIERYITNFVSEVPLPPQGKIEVLYHLTGDLSLKISRPPANRLPMARFGYRPLFSTLSTGNIMVVIGTLLQEGRVALCAKSYALLAPVAEALISLLFPFVYQGIYIPVMPFSMLDVLDAPVPFMIGINSRYLRSVPPSYRPTGVIFVDLDEDIVHLGIDDDGADSQHGESIYGRLTPQLPEKDAAKLKIKLDECGGVAYQSPACGIKGRITYGHGEHMPNADREFYCREARCTGTRRAAVLEKLDTAFIDEDYRDGVHSFVTEAGTMVYSGQTASSTWKMKGVKKQKKSDAEKSHDAESPTYASSPREEGGAGVVHLLEAPDESSDGFSAMGIREAFLRFFVSLMKRYEKYIIDDDDDVGFQHDDFVDDFSLNKKERDFVGKIVGAQFFERFVEERVANPNQSEVRFFDESIIAKDNRSVKKTIAKGGKRETPFLADESGRITETFTPPPPSNWGLPADGRSYHYVSFPRLQDDLFGKIRTPKQWEQVSRQRRGASTAALGQQQRILSKVLMPSSSERPFTTLDNQTKDVEWAIHLLARHATGKDDTTGQDEAEGESSQGIPLNDVRRAKTLILSSNRRQSNLLAQIIKLQSLFRMHAQYLQYGELRRAAAEKCISPEIREVVKEKKMDIMMSAVICQRLIRGYQARKVAGTRLEAVRCMQHWGRGILIRHSYQRLLAGTIMTQAMARGRRVRFLYKLTLGEVANIQAQARGWITRRNVSRLRRTRVFYYRIQLFELWRHCRISLAYRSNFWTLIDGSGYLDFSLIEKELSRCWDLLNIDFSTLADGKSPSTATSRYHRYLFVEELLEAARPKKDRIQEKHAKLVPCFPSEQPGTSNHAGDIRKAQLLHQASEQLTLERLCIYERLATIKDKGTLARIYAALSIPMDAKLKKRTFAEHIWTWSELADQSSALIFTLFPEAKGDNCIRSSTAPTKKAKKRFDKLTTYQPPPKDEQLFVKAKIDELIKSDLRDVAIAFLCGMQSILAKMDTNQVENKKQSSDDHFVKQRDAIAARLHNIPWKQQKYMLIEDFLYEDSLYGAGAL